MIHRRAILFAMILATFALRGCGSRAEIAVAVENKAGVMIKDCAIRFEKGDLHTGVVLTDGRREFSYFVTPISDSASVDVDFANNKKKSMKVYIGSKYDPTRPGTLVFQIAADSVRVIFEPEK